METNTVTAGNNIMLNLTSDALSGADLITFVARADTKGVKQGETVRALVPSTYSVNELSAEQTKELIELSLRAAFIEMIREQVKEAKPSGLYNGDTVSLPSISAVDIFTWLTEKAERSGAPYKPTKEEISALVSILLPCAEALYMARAGVDTIPEATSTKMSLAYNTFLSTLVTKNLANDALEKLEAVFSFALESDNSIANNKAFAYFNKRINKLLNADSELAGFL